MMVVTGAAGFVGSCLIQRLNELNFNYIVAVDHFDNPDKMKNLENKKIQEFVNRDNFFEWLENNE
jgi:ADP-L-glycero-D-manno-heptose 6-epimerase